MRPWAARAAPGYSSFRVGRPPGDTDADFLQYHSHIKQSCEVIDWPAGINASEDAHVSPPTQVTSHKRSEVSCSAQSTVHRFHVLERSGIAKRTASVMCMCLPVDVAMYRKQTKASPSREVFSGKEAKTQAVFPVRTLGFGSPNGDLQKQPAQEELSNSVCLHHQTHPVLRAMQGFAACFFCRLSLPVAFACILPGRMHD